MVKKLKFKSVQLHQKNIVNGKLVFPSRCVLLEKMYHGTCLSILYLITKPSTIYIYNASVYPWQQIITTVNQKTC